MHRRAVLIAASAALLLPVGAEAAAARPVVSLSRPAGLPGARVVLTGHHFVPRARFRVTIAGLRATRGRFGPRGGTRVTFQVPAKAPGRYRVRLFWRGRVTSLPFRITAAAPGPAPLLPEPQPEQPAQPEPPPPPPPPPDPPKLVAAGDIACSPNQEASKTDTECHEAQTATLIDTLQPDAVAALGDDQYEHGELANFQAMYDPSWGAFKDITFPAIGNHEYEGDPERDQDSGYFEYFGDAAGDPAKGYYRWSLGKWTIFVLNSGAIDYTVTGAGSAMPDDCWPVSCATGSAQLDWLTGELDSLPEDACVLAYWHHPRFSSGFGDENQDYAETGPMYQALYDHGAELLLNGHAHNYERFEPVDPAGAPDAATGITNFVVGTGGRSLFTQPGPQEDISQTLYTDAFGVLELALQPNGWSSRFVTEAGEVRDEASGSCHGPPAA